MNLKTVCSLQQDSAFGIAMTAASAAPSIVCKAIAGHGKKIEYFPSRQA
jgi:hypothetical protein